MAVTSLNSNSNIVITMNKICPCPHGVYILVKEKENDPIGNRYEI